MSTATHTPSENDHNLTQISEDVAQLKVHNHTVPVSQFPSDLLLEIMFACKYHHEVGHRAGTSEFQGIPRLNASYRWIRVSQVCRHWRAVALSSPLLWTSIHIPRASPEWVDELLRRSHLVPVSLNFHDSNSQGAMVKGLLECWSDRLLERPIHRLRLWYPRSRPSDLSRLPLGHLKEFELAVDPWSHKSDYHSFLSHVAAFSSNLTSLVLMRMTLDKRLLHETLTVLSLRAAATTSDTTWDELLSALGSMKRLSHLHLDKILSELQPSLVNRSMLITLPQLESLTLLNDATEIHMKFLQLVSIPREAAINLKNQTEDVQAFAAAVPSLSQALALSSPSHPHLFLALEVASSNFWGSVSIGIDYSLPRQFGDPMRYPRMFQCEVRRGFSLDVFKQSIDELIQSLPLTHIQHIYLKGDLGDFPPSLLRIFSTVKGLETLSIDEPWSDPCITRALVSTLPQCHSECSNSISTTTGRSASSLCISCKSCLETWFPQLQRLRYRGRWHGPGPRRALMEPFLLVGYLPSRHSSYVRMLQTVGNEVAS